MKTKSECAPVARNGQATPTHAAESSQLQMVMAETISSDEIWSRFKIAQKELNQLIEETGEENERRN